ncbi:MAG: hypothetical protein ACFFDB_00675 [Promethearchaeota archaeon]
MSSKKSDKIQEEIISLRKMDKKLKEIKDKTGVSIPTIRKILKDKLKNYEDYNRNKVPESKKKKAIQLIKKSKTLDEIAEELNLGVSTIHKILNEEFPDYKKYLHTKGRRVSNEKLHIILKLLKQEKDITQIANHKSVSLSTNTVSKYINKLERLFYIFSIYPLISYWK